MTYQEAVAYLESLIDYERTPAGAAAARVWNLDRTRHLLAAAGDPHLKLRTLHIAGTKGKGSTAAMAASILRAAGYRTGLYTSPHLVSFRERIRVDGEMVSEADVVALVERARPIIEGMREGEIGMPSFFEAYTLLGFLSFAEHEVDVAVLETGLGGRLDATNVASPIACALTRIGMDHMTELGESLALIAGEKAGIIKPGVPVISAPQVPEVLEVFQEVALERGAQLLVVGSEAGPRVLATAVKDFTQVFTIEGLERRYEDLDCPLLGGHQAENAAVAIGLVELAARGGLAVGYETAPGGLVIGRETAPGGFVIGRETAPGGFVIGEEAVRKGLAEVRWPGRFQVVSRRPFIALDGAHDDVGAEALAKTIESLLGGRRLLLVFGTGRDKDAEAIARRLCPLADQVILTQSSSPRAIPAEELQRLVFSLSKHTSAITPVGEAVRRATRLAKREDAIVITGSLYVVGEAMQALGVPPE